MIPNPASLGRRLAGLAAGLLLLAACNTAPEQPPPSPALWEITGQQGQHGYLFGTVHSLPKAYRWRTERLDKAFASSDRLMVEVDLAAQGKAISAIFTRLSRSPGLPPVSARLSGSRRAELEQAMKARGLTDKDFEGLESWAAALALAQAYDDGDKGEGVDLSLIRQAGKRGIIELEGAEPQLRLFDALPEDDQRDLLASVAQEALEGEKASDERLKHWLTGNAAALEKETREGMLADPGLREALLLSRNRAWSEKAARELDKGGTVFIATGAAHMVGREGLASLLAERGYSLKRVQ
ncbi:MAG TPA: TraB/GumN family protein [Sphingomonadaceae bacterium]|nr:TraB/GumN family protein [Sphingomonadaceae bacterium]